jgi:alpha-methylacyl-CoA racemase
MGLDRNEKFSVKNQYKRSLWSENMQVLQSLFATKSRDEWVSLFKETDCCFTPVLTLDEAMEYPHNKQRKLYTRTNGTVLPNTAPRFQSLDRGESVSMVPSLAPLHPGGNSREVLTYFNISSSRIDSLLREGIVKQSGK